MLVDRLSTLRLVVVTGKGGTGKSVTATALARILAGRGRRTLLLEVDPRENLHHLCGVPPSGGEIVEVARDLWLQNLKPAAVVDWVVEKQVKIGVVVRRILKSPVYQRFVEGAPGLTEIAILGHALRVVRGEIAEAPAIHTVVLDAPSTGHGLFLLTAPRLFVETIGEGPFAELASQVAGFVNDPGETGLVIVTLAEEMPVQEALELRAALADKLGRRPELLVTNGLYPPVDDAGGDALTELWRNRRRVNDKELQRLAERWQGPRVELPLLPVDEGAGLVAALTELLAGALAAEEEAA